MYLLELDFFEVAFVKFYFVDTYLATGDQITALALAYRIGVSTCNSIIKETCCVISEVLAPIYLKCPDEIKWRTIASHFLNKWNMPNCIGLLDGKHAQVQAPQNSGIDYFNYKKYFSIVLLAVCDADYKFTLVDIGSPGSNGDGSIFSTHLGNALKNNELNIPQVLAQLPDSEIKIPYFMVGDLAFQ